MKRRIVQLIPTLDQGGAEKQFSLLATGLPSDEFEVHVCVLTRTGPWESTLQEAQLPIEFIDKKHKFDPSAYRRLKKYLKSVRPDLVQTWLFAGNTYGRLAARASGCKKVIASERCVDQWKSWHQLAIDRQLAKRTDRIVVNSSGVEEFYANEGIPKEKLTVIPNGIELGESDSISSNSIREELGLPKETLLIGAVGRLWPQKRFKDLIWSADLIKCIRDDAHLLIVGDGPQRFELERYAEQVEILDKVHFLGHRNDAPNIIRQLNVLWSGSEFEGMSNVIMEAMTAKVPVVATDISGNRDLVEHDVTGALVPVGDRASLAKWAAFLFDHPEKAESLTAAAYEQIATKFTVEQMINRHADLYRELLD